MRQEVDENIEALYKNPAMTLPKVEAVLKEVLRVYPTAPFISRRTSDELTIKDVTIPANVSNKKVLSHDAACFRCNPRVFL